MASILEQLTQHVPSLPPKMASAARFALDNPDFIALNSMRSAATQCGVTSPTMLRLAQMLKFKNYSDFKKAFQQDIIADGFKNRAQKLTSSKPSKQQMPILQSITKAAINNLESTLEKCNCEDLKQMAKHLLSARNACVIGMGSLHPIATFMQATGRMSLPGLRVPHIGEYTLIEILGALGEGDVVLLLSVSPYAKSTVEALKFIHQQKATVMVITDKRSSPLLKYADLHVLTTTNSLHYYPSSIPIVAIIEALLATVVAEGGKEVSDRIAKIEKIREKSGSYLL